MNPQRLKQDFVSRKKGILEALGFGTDASPKGSVDEPIIPIMELLNSYPEAVTTSSCSGRVSVFLEGKKQSSETSIPSQDDGANIAAAGGKGGDGRWLFVTHDPLPDNILQENQDDVALLNTLFGGVPSEAAVTQLPAVELSSETRYVHFKFEPMILHILTEKLEVANKLLACATSSSFRESGIVSPLKNPVVAIRTTGLAFDAPIGIYDPSRKIIYRLIEPPGLRLLGRLTSDRFRENSKRIKSLHEHFKAAIETFNEPFESKQTRARRKRAEGIDKGRLITVSRESRGDGNGDPLDYGILF